VAHARHLAVPCQEAQLTQADAHGLRQVARMVQRGQGVARQRLAVAVRVVQAAGDAVAHVQQLALAPLVPGQGARMAALREALAGFLAALAGAGHALLAHDLQGPVAVLDAAQFAAELRERGLQLALAADQLLLDRRLRRVARPEAQALHFLEDDFLLGTLADALVQLLAGERRVGHGR